MDSAMDTFDGWPNQTISEITRLRSENAELQGRLDHSVAKIMKLQGGVEQITGGDVKKRFERLYGAIQDWVAEIELDLMRHSRDFRDVFREIVHYENKDRLLLELGLREEGDDEATWNRNSKDYGKMRWLGQLDTCINVVLSRLIWCRLFNDIFVTYYPLGLDDDATKGFDYMIEAIEGDSDGNATKESFLQANKWRSETMITLVSTKKFKTDKESQMQDFRRMLWEELSQKPISLEPETLQKHFQGLDTNVLVPAGELKQAIACSSIKYGITEPEELLRRTLPEAGRLRNYSLKDIAKWRDTDPSEAFGGIYCYLFPGIYQVGIGLEDSVPLVKPVVLVFDREAGQQIQEQSQTRDLKQFTPQRSPTRIDKPVQPIPSPIPSRSSTARSLEDSGRREGTRSESSRSGGRFSKFFKSTKQAEERSNPEAKAQLSRRESEDKSSRGTSSRELREKEKRLRRAATAPVKSSHRLAAATTSDPSAHPRSEPAREGRRKSPVGDDVTPTNTVVNLPSMAGQRSPSTQNQSEDESGDGTSEEDSMETHSSSDMEEGDEAGLVTVERDGVVIQQYHVAMAPLSRSRGVDKNSPEFRQLSPRYVIG